MSILRLFDGLKPKSKRQPRMQIDALGLLESGLNRYVCYMDKTELKRHVLQIGPNITGHIIIIGGLGVVDGFTLIHTTKTRKVPVTIFELRNAQYYIKTPLDSIDKNKHGQFDADSLYGSLMQFPDLKVFDGVDHSGL